MVRIIFFDIDGTLTDDVYGMPKSAAAAVQLCRQNGYLVFLCTGRAPGVIPDSVLALNCDGMIAGGGCYIELNHQVLWDRSFPAQMVADACSYLEARQAAFALESHRTVYMNEKARAILCSLNAEKQRSAKAAQRLKLEQEEKIVYEDNIGCFRPNRHRIGKICFWSSEQVFQELTSRFSVPVGLAQRMRLCDQMYYEIIQDGCDKGRAIRFLCERLRISPSEALAFGNGRNDMDMFREVGTAVAVAGSDAALISCADSVCEPPIEDGIFRELKRRQMI